MCSNEIYKEQTDCAQITICLKINLLETENLFPVHFAADVVVESIGIAEGTEVKIKQNIASPKSKMLFNEPSNTNNKIQIIT